MPIRDAHAVTGVSISNTGNLGALEMPVAAATATAIGNLGSAITRVGIRGIDRDEST